MSPIVTGLIITGIGMGLVFIAILVLWGLMDLMSRIPDAPEAKEEQEETADLTSVAPGDAPAQIAPAKSDRQKAAALAVAVALAVRQSSAAVATRPAADVSAWQATLRASRMSQNAQVYSRKRGSVR